MCFEMNLNIFALRLFSGKNMDGSEIFQEYQQEYASIKEGITEKLQVKIPTASIGNPLICLVLKLCVLKTRRNSIQTSWPESLKRPTKLYSFKLNSSPLIFHRLNIWK